MKTPTELEILHHQEILRLRGINAELLEALQEAHGVILGAAYDVRKMADDTPDVMSKHIWNDDAMRLDEKGAEIQVVIAKAAL